MYQSPLCSTLVSLDYPPSFVYFRPVSYPENHYSLSPAGGDRPYRNPSASFSSPPSGLVSLTTMGPPGISPGPFVRYKPSPDRCVGVGVWCFTLQALHCHSFDLDQTCLVLLVNALCAEGGIYWFKSQAE